MLEVLSESDVPLPSRQVFGKVRERMPLTGREESRNAGSRVRAGNYLGFRSGALGLVDKAPDGWSITDAGRQFLHDHRDDDMERVFGRFYRRLHRSQPALERRAWLVRGSSVAGVNVVPQWLAGGFVSLRAQRLREMDVTADRTQIDAAVAEAYSTRGVAYRQTKTREYDRFLHRMAVGDLVLTTAEGLVYLGQLTGEPFWAPDDEPLPARLRRSAEWLNDTTPVAFAELPVPLPGRLGAAGDLVDLTDSLAVVEALLGTDAVAGDDVPGGVIVKRAALPGGDSGAGQ